MRKPLNRLLILSIGLFSLSVFASEQAELEQAIRQLEATKQALYRAKSTRLNTKAKDRVYFDYVKANQDIDLIQAGIDRYLNSHRAQPRDPRKIRTLSGEYDRIRAEAKK